MLTASESSASGYETDAELMLLSTLRESSADKPKVAISACLAGQAVRYDGTDKHLGHSWQLIDQWLDLVPVCPEVGAGMPVPRPPVQLVYQQPGNIAVLGRDDPDLEVTSMLDQFRQQSMHQFGTSLTGYIWKSRSPSCGLGSTPVFNTIGEQIKTSSGYQAAFFQRQQPWLQMTDENQLTSDTRCKQFISRCQVLLEVRLACEDNALADIHDHHSRLFAEMDTDHQQVLKRALNNQDGGLYWRTFGVALQSLFNR